MPGAYTIDPARSLVLSRGWGVLTGAELIRHARTLAADPRFKPHFSQLSDLREVTEFRVDAPVVREVAALNPFGAGARRALVVATDVAFGVAEAKAKLLRALSEAAPRPDTD